MSTQAAMFLCPSKFSIGELHNALVAGRDLLAGGWRVQCMVSRRNLDYAKSSETDAELLSESGKDAEAVLHRVRAIAPDLLVLADHHIWALEPTAASIRELLELGFPSLAADSLCLGPGARSLKLAIAHHPGRRTHTPMIPVNRRSACSARGSPHHPSGAGCWPAQGRGVREVCLGSAPHALEEPGPAAARIRARPAPARARALHVDGSHPRPTRPWTISWPRSRGAAPKTYYQYMDDWFSGILDLVDEPIAIVGIQDTSRVEASTSRTQFVSTGLLDVDEFDSLQAAADLYVSDNLTSGVMAQAAPLGTSVLAMLNTTGASPEAFPSSAPAQQERRKEGASKEWAS